MRRAEPARLEVFRQTHTMAKPLRQSQNLTSLLNLFKVIHDVILSRFEDFSKCNELFKSVIGVKPY